MPLTLKNNNEVFKQIFEIANQFDKEQENYLIAYSHFLNYFKKTDVLTLDDIVIGISFTYSWMPTILKKLI
ncbi:hypothetical protein [Acinetobacter indicus]|uniref:hypothetical protein n=1 Tax=Acinetobacter indicus TaxID=756892 RepID=UPI001D193E3E|nr:hypothetical protein [Acinetobacter indicus]